MSRDVTIPVKTPPSRPVSGEQKNNKLWMGLITFRSHDQDWRWCWGSAKNSVIICNRVTVMADDSYMPPTIVQSCDLLESSVPRKEAKLGSINSDQVSIYDTWVFSYLPVSGMPEKPNFFLISMTSRTVWEGLRTMGSLINPCLNFFTLCTSLAWNSTLQLWWIIPGETKSEATEKHYITVWQNRRIKLYRDFRPNGKQIKINWNILRYVYGFFVVAPSLVWDNKKTNCS